MINYLKSQFNVCPLNQGQIYTIKDLLTQAALPSSNSAAMILGEQVSGNTSTFTDKMNAQAKAFHMKHTYFVNQQVLLMIYLDNKHQRNINRIFILKVRQKILRYYLIT